MLFCKRCPPINGFRFQIYSFVTLRYQSVATLTVSNMHLISLMAPKHPRKEMRVTMTPVAMRMDAELTYKSLPSKRSMKARSASVHTPTANTDMPHIWKKIKEDCLIYNTYHTKISGFELQAESK